VTLAVQVAAFIQLSVTVKMTVFAPKFEQLKLVLLKDKLIVLHPSELLLLTAPALVAAFPVLSKFMLMSLHSAMGTTSSLTKIVLDTEANVLPQKSMAVQVSNTWPLQFPATTTEKVEVLEVPLIAQFPL
jgi:hypothetical protein